MADVAEAPVEVTEAPADAPEVSGLEALSEALDNLETQVDEAEAAQEGEAPKPEAKPEPEDPFSEKALATKEGIAAARAKIAEERSALQKRNRKLDDFDIKLKKKSQSWETKKADELQALQNDRNIARVIQAHLGVFRSGTPEQILSSLGQLTGKSGKQVWQDLTETMLRDGKAPPVTHEVEALKSEIAQLRDFLKNQQTEQQKAVEQARQEHAINYAGQWREQLVQQASNAETYPHLAQYVAMGKGPEVARYVTQLIHKFTDSGEPADDSTCLQFIESEIASLTSSAGAPKPSPGQVPASKPGGSRAQRTPAASISPSVTRSGSVREMTQAEREAALASDPSLLSEVFGL